MLRSEHWRANAVAILAQVLRFKHFREAARASMELTVVLASFLDDLTLLRFTSSSRSNAWAYPIVRWREHAVARALICQLALLADHTGATDTATWREQDWQADTEWFMQHSWPDWDDSD